MIAGSREYAEGLPRTKGKCVLSAKEIDVVCPCCETRLTIDVLTRTVMRSAGARETDEFGKLRVDEARWDQAADKVKDRGDSAVDRLDSALQKERERADRLDDLFDRARKKHEEGDE